MQAKRVAIIGAGASGLPALKCCLDEGLIPVCFERTGDIGGLWNFTEEVREHQSCVAKSTIINVSKEMLCYSDFPIPKEYANYMHNTKVWEYLNKYADNFKLKGHIRFYTNINRVKKSANFDRDGSWELEIKDVQSGKTTNETFDAVLVCTGHHAEKHYPYFPGEEDFEGKITHAHDYRDSRGFEGKRLIVVGIGNSGGDATVELSRVSSQVFLSTRHGAWIAHRVFKGGLPIDIVITRRILAIFNNFIPTSLQNSMVESDLNQRFDHSMYGLKPQHRFFEQHPTVSDALPERIVCGSVIVKPNIKRFTKNGMEFEDGTIEENIDHVIYATGYDIGFPFIDKSVIDVKNNKVNLYKYVFPPTLTKPTLAVIGCVQPIGSLPTLSEMQCRWATRVFKGSSELPSQEQMWKDIKDKKQAMAKRYVASQRHTIQVDYIPYMDELAEQVACKPDLWKLFLSDPKLAMECLLGPCTAYQYRLMGPLPWDGARDAIMTQWDRIYFPLKTRKVVEDGNTGLVFLLLPVLVLAILAWMIMG